MMIDWAVWTFETIFCMVFATILNWRAEYWARYQFLTAAARPNYTPSKTTPGVSRASALFIFLVMALVAAPIMSTLITSLLGPGELAPGISAAEFQERRRRLAAAMPRDSVAVLPATATAYMTGVIPYPHRQDADFLYLTGLDQPGSVAVVHGQTGELTLFVPTPDATRELWDGARVSAAAAASEFGASEVHLMRDLPRLLPDLLRGTRAVYYDADKHAKGELGRWAPRELGFAEATHRPLRGADARAALEKRALMARSAAVAEAGLLAAMRADRAGSPGERHLAADFEARCRRAGAARLAYPSVVASGADACTIHYSRNDKPLRDGDLLLFDGGCELHGYCSDVTRTWPLGGAFSPAQRDAYDLVHGVQAALLAWCRPGMTLRQLHERSVRLVCEGLVDLRLAPSLPLARAAYRAFYPHSVGHWLGMDTHDTPSVSHDRPLEPGVHLTIEPGLYVPDDERFGALAGIGVRIEDVVRINDTAECTVLSQSMPTDAQSIEDYLARARQ
ncbi:hypothetical protein QBZ16_002914 [Prototheca wickerhamii]|uniref:Aminopeptidase P N-terminal domain-containing protein n=1 Tax=Prototheca wickerhamii TaxID=3111 RepID=A0AAD9IJ37_PROWI|nr:hypothetical protein QBZ16_002914 [Prototheca wickerhamii]